MKKRKTAGQLSLEAASDTTKYDPLEIGHALTDDVGKELYECARRHRNIFDENEYCVGFVLAGDPLIKNVLRRKFFAMLYLPSPRPNQSIFLYNKQLDQITKRLWVLPNANMMAYLSETVIVDAKYKTMKAWSDAFFTGWQYDKASDKWINYEPTNFFKYIRQMHNINLPSEKEFLNANREELIKAGAKESSSVPTDSFDFNKVMANKVVDSAEVGLQKS